ncbi:unnamed protein product [Pseudo-nitzschia multistriata]|uniref:Sulfotransferase domain-containing protein n=1 Tax=Pseudo-nitzschia multistriata TaxID=183589 RepID=A0A448YYG0_9STRA|nr:unnamed protein product [Pseudo-nitzschia multistriata]
MLSPPSRKNHRDGMLQRTITLRHRDGILVIILVAVVVVVFTVVNQHHAIVACSNSFSAEPGGPMDVAPPPRYSMESRLSVSATPRTSTKAAAAATARKIVFSESPSSSHTKNGASPACLPLQKFKTDDYPNSHKKTMDLFGIHNPGQKNYTRLVFLHMRKAGGTTLYSYLKKVTNSRRTTLKEFIACEGFKDCLELNNYEDGFHKYNDDERNATMLWKNRNEIPYPRPFPSLNWDDSGSTFYVTHLREPIARAISHYKYDQRWSCDISESRNSLRYMNISRHVTRELARANNSTKHDKFTFYAPSRATNKTYFVPSSENQKMEIEEWATELFPIFKDKKGRGNHMDLAYRPKRDKLWHCSTNCYARWATGMYHPDQIYESSFPSRAEYNRTYPFSNYYYKQKGNKNRPWLLRKMSEMIGNDGDQEETQSSNEEQELTDFGKTLTEEALKILLRYDLIIVLEWLKDPEYVHHIEGIFAGIHGLHDKTPSFCDQESKYANNLAPPRISNETRELIWSRNEIDRNLYERLTSCAEQG